MQDIRIGIKGMHCQSCVQIIETDLNSLEGVYNVKVDLSKEFANVKFDPQKVSQLEIETKIKESGYNKDIKEENKKKKGGFLKGILYGIIPHVGCIAFIIGSILGVTVLMNVFKPILMNRYIFHALIGISLGFATLSSGLYLKKNNLLSKFGVKKKWKYLTVMYGSTIGINLVLFMLIFPLLANVNTSSLVTGAVVGIPADSTIKLKVNIPCPGHAPLISEELKTINGVKNIQFGFPNNFDVTFDTSVTSVDKIISLKVFETYKAKIISNN